MLLGGTTFAGTGAAFGCNLAVARERSRLLIALASGETEELLIFSMLSMFTNVLRKASRPSGVQLNEILGNTGEYWGILGLDIKVAAV